MQSSALFYYKLLTVDIKGYIIKILLQTCRLQKFVLHIYFSAIVGLLLGGTTVVLP